jgi:hypothetical protein
MQGGERALEADFPNVGNGSKPGIGTEADSRPAQPRASVLSEELDPPPARSAFKGEVARDVAARRSGLQPRSRR